MKKRIVLIILLVVFGLKFKVSQANAQMGSMMDLGNDEQTSVSTDQDQVESIESVLKDILTGQGVSTVQELNLDKVSDDDWAMLGDAVMEVRHPGDAHQAMDEMMGGEGSDSLRQMHISMGQAYLGYKNGNYNFGAFGHGGMMGLGMMGYGPTSYYSHWGLHLVLCGITWLLAVAFLASGTYFFIRKAGKK